MEEAANGEERREEEEGRMERNAGTDTEGGGREGVREEGEEEIDSFRMIMYE